MITKEQFMELCKRCWVGSQERSLHMSLGLDDGKVIIELFREDVTAEDLPDLEARIIAAAKAFRGEKP